MLLDEVVEPILRLPHLFRIGTKAIYKEDSAAFAALFIMNAVYEGTSLTTHSHFFLIHLQNMAECY
jgi:hypothetical protein